jgi:hypothetical protein|nr:MAG TPA: hypothetical protein [Caudoviricetes sp.]
MLAEEMNRDEEVQINYDAIKKLHDHAELLKREMQTIMNHSYRQKIKAQAMVLYHVCDTIATYTMSRSKAIYQWDTFVVDMMGCYYLLYSVYTSRVLELRDVLEVCENSDEAWVSFEWIIDALRDFGESVTLRDRDTWIYNK